MHWSKNNHYKCTFTLSVFSHDSLLGTVRKLHLWQVLALSLSGCLTSVGEMDKLMTVLRLRLRYYIILHEVMPRPAASSYGDLVLYMCIYCSTHRRCCDKRLESLGVTYGNIPPPLSLVSLKGPHHAIFFIF